MIDTDRGHEGGRVLSPLPGPPFRGPGTSTSAPMTVFPRLEPRALAATRRSRTSSSSSLARGGPCSSASTTPTRALVFGWVVSALGPDCDEGLREPARDRTRARAARVAARARPRLRAEAGARGARRAPAADRRGAVGRRRMGPLGGESGPIWCSQTAHGVEGGFFFALVALFGVKPGRWAEVHGPRLVREVGSATASRAKREPADGERRSSISRCRHPPFIDDDAGYGV